MTAIRIAGTDLAAERVPTATAILAERIFDPSGRVLGTIEYVRLESHGASHYGWRPAGSTWARSALANKRTAALALPVCDPDDVPWHDVHDH